MICHNCGKELENGSMYCNRCGANQYNPSAGPVTLGEHPYRRLGGVLKFFLVMSILGVAINLFTGFSSLRDTDILADQYKVNGAVMNALLAAEKILFGANLILCLFVIKQLVSREPTFLLMFELLSLSSVAVDAVSAVVTVRIYRGTEYEAAVNSSLIPLAIGSLAGTVLWLIYFRRSVRVRTYMGSEKYLRRSILARRAKSPTPAAPDPADENDE